MIVPMPDQEPQAHSELASFGEELRREREIRGISLKEIADATKISKRFLEAIERNDHRTLPAPVFTRGFVREYARYVGLSCEEMVNRYNFAAAGDDRIEKSAQLDRLVQPVLPVEREPAKKKGIPPAYARIDRNVYLLLILIAALAGVAWWAIAHKRAEAELARAEVARAAATENARRRTVVAAPAALTPPVPKVEEPLRLVLELTDDCYLDLEVDGKTVMKDDYRLGTHETLEAKVGFNFKRIGNATAVILMLNDKQIPPLGRDGQVIRNRVFDRAYLETLK
jgi:transcriptional regulator with XRE-family HTH domain